MAIVMTRDGKVKVTIPSIDEKDDGSLWYKGLPLLAIKDQDVKIRIAKLAKAKKYEEIPAECFAKMGDNPDGVWVGDARDWHEHPARVAARAKKEAEEAKQGTIYLSSRGWGDYSGVEWHGDITRKTSAILAECRSLLDNYYDVDSRNQTDEEIIAKINEERAKKQKKEADKKNEADRRAELLATAKKTGEKQAIESWMTDECSEHGRLDCSFDHAVLWAMPDGTTKVTYTHCY